MTKSLMIPMQPQQVADALNGKRKIDLRTWIPKGYVGWVYVYVTKGKPYLVNFYNELPCYAINDYTYKEILDDGNTPLNGKVAFRFWFDEYAEINPNQTIFESHTIYYEQYDNSYPDEDIEQSGVIDIEHLEEITQVSLEDMQKYSKGKYIYGWHMNKLEIFDEPKELSEFYRLDCPYYMWFISEDEFIPLKNAPKKSVWVYTKENKK